MQAFKLTGLQLIRGWPSGTEIGEDVEPPVYSAREFIDRPGVDDPSEASRAAKVEEEQLMKNFRGVLTREEAASRAGLDQQKVEAAVAVLKRTFGVPDVIFADFGPKARIKPEDGQSVALTVFIPGVWIDDYIRRQESPRSSIFRWEEADDLCRSPGAALARMETTLNDNGGSVDLTGRVPFKKETMGQPVDPGEGATPPSNESPGSNQPEDLEAMSKVDLVNFAAEMTPPLELSSHSKRVDLLAAVKEALAKGAVPRDPSPPVE